MRLKSLIHEDYIQYKKPSMFLGTCFCDFKCEKESGCDCHCQNGPSYGERIRVCDDEQIIDSYIKNPLTSSVVFGGFEPFLQFDELISFIDKFRNKCDDDIVIYTGYREDELSSEIDRLRKYRNIILKVGRYVPNQKPHFDTVLGVELASDNQYGILL